MNSSCSSATIGDHVHVADRGTSYAEALRPDGIRDARSLIIAQARLIAAAKRRKRRKKSSGEPYYGSSRLPEEIICYDSRHQALGDVVTRNHYGCLVLNAARTLFIDVDVLPNDKHEQSDCRQGQWDGVLDDVRVVLAAERNDGFRIYRTAAGYRILATTHEYEPGSPRAERLMDALGADPAFVELCRVQQSFRARLTPKPWRCRMRRPPNAFPRQSTEEGRRFADWLAQYERACRDRATCRYVGHVGPEDTDARIAPVIEFHDRETKALELLQLA